MTENRRQTERFSVYAQIELQRDGETVVLSVRNLSLGGAFVEAPLGDFPNIRVGTRFDVIITLGGDDDAAEPPDVFARCAARVLRRDRTNPPGFAIAFEPPGPEQKRDLEAVIAAAPRR